MSWDHDTKPKRMRKKQKKLLLWLSFTVSLIFVTILSLFEGFDANESSMSVITKIAESVLSEEEKKVIWEGMSDEGKAVLKKHMPDPARVD